MAKIVKKELKRILVDVVTLDCGCEIIESFFCQKHMPRSDLVRTEPLIIEPWPNE